MTQSLRVAALILAIAAAVPTAAAPAGESRGSGGEVGPPTRLGGCAAQALPRLRLLTAGDSDTTDSAGRAAAETASRRSGRPNSDTRALQQRLADLGFLALSAVDGVAGEETRFAVIAFQKWEWLTRDGIGGRWLYDFTPIGTPVAVLARS